MATINPISLALRRVQHIKQHAINVVKNKEQLRNVFAHFENNCNSERGSPSKMKKRKEKQEKKLQYTNEASSLNCQIVEKVNKNTMQFFSHYYNLSKINVLENVLLML